LGRPRLRGAQAERAPAGFDQVLPQRFVVDPDVSTQSLSRRRERYGRPMAEMSMNKAIHGAFRRDLDRFLGALGRFRDGDTVRADDLWKAWQNFESQLTRHHHGEHDIAWPALEQIGVTKEVLAEMDAEHDRLAEALAAAGKAMDTLRTSASSADAQSASAAMERLHAVAVEHLDHEEAEIEPIYLAKADDPAVKAMGRKFGKVSPKEGGTFFAWVSDGATPDEMRAITANVPKPVITIIGGIFGRSYRREIAPVWTR
jgi:hemerythrin-like domain-containing protein